MIFEWGKTNAHAYDSNQDCYLFNVEYEGIYTPEFTYYPSDL